MPEENVASDTVKVTPARPYPAWFRAGFFGAFGVAAMALLALVAWRLFQATLAVSTPFLLGTVLTLLLDPLVDRLQRRGLSRMAATGIVFGAFVLLLVGAGWLVIPALINQASQLAENGPRYIASLQTNVNDFLTTHPRIMGFKLPPNFNVLSAELSDKVSQTLTSSSGEITGFLVGSVTTLLEMIITLIVTFYLLLDIDRFRARLFYLMPERVRGPAAGYAHDIGEVFADYLRGLLIVSGLYGIATLGLFLGLTVAHHEIGRYALLVAVAGGLLYTIPYLGPLVTALITFLIAFASGGIGFGGLAVLLTLVLNQIFDNIITPRVVGGGVGLHPVLSLFALTLGGTLFGIWGMLLAVPIAASIQVILFRLFPKLTSPTPPAFLQAEGVRADKGESATVMAGDQAKTRPDL